MFLSFPPQSTREENPFPLDKGTIQLRRAFTRVVFNPHHPEYVTSLRHSYVIPCALETHHADTDQAAATVAPWRLNNAILCVYSVYVSPKTCILSNLDTFQSLVMVQKKRGDLDLTTAFHGSKVFRKTRVSDVGDVSRTSNFQFIQSSLFFFKPRTCVWVRFCLVGFLSGIFV